MLRLSTWPKILVHTHCLNPAIGRSHSFSVEQALLLGRLKAVETGYSQDLRCMEGTRQFLLAQLMTWATNGSGQKLKRNIYWIYGLPGIGKSSISHSICASLHEEKRLAGAVFCRRDDPNLKEPRNIIPTLIYKLAIIFPHFRSVVAQSLRNDPNLTPESMKYTVFLDLIRKLRRPPKSTLIFVIDALDECGNDRSRQRVLKVLADAAALAPWLKIIITSRPELDIQQFFNTLTQSSHIPYDLTADEKATSDLRIFAQDRFSGVASKRHLPSPWPEPLLFDGVISRAAGLFIFIETVALALQTCEDPTELLKSTLQDSASAGLKSLYTLYTSILKARIVHSVAKFQRVIGVVLTTASYRSLCEETIAELAGVNISQINTWVDELSSLLYREKGDYVAIRIRHLSIFDFFLSGDCPSDFQVNTGDSNGQLSVACLTTMVRQLRFNICGLEDSRRANSDIKDLKSRIEKNISDPLQYSSRYWSNHLCSTPDIGDPRVWEILKEFFGGLYPLLWIEALSVMGIVPIGAPSLRQVTSWINVSTTPAYRWFVILMFHRMPTRPSVNGFRKFVISLSPSTSPSLSALHTPIFRHDLSYPHKRPCQPRSAQRFLKPSRCRGEHCRLGQSRHCNGSGTPVVSIA